MSSPLDELRQRLGIVEPAGDGNTGGNSSQETPERVAGSVNSLSAFELLTVRQKAYQQEMELLQQGGDDRDGLEGLRRAFRRAGRG